MQSHSGQFNVALLAALASPAQPVAAPAPLPASSSADCTNAVGTVISGYQRVITIKRCKGVSIVDAVAEQILIEDSLVSLHNVQVRAPQGAALSARDSVLVGTNVQLSGERAIDASHCRLDLAGASLSAERQILLSRGKSRVIMSVSEAKLAGVRQFLHGDYRLQDQRLEDVAGRP